MQTAGQKNDRRYGFAVALSAHVVLLAAIGMCLSQIADLMTMITGLETKLADESAEVQALIVWPWLLLGAVVVITLDILVLRALFADERPGQAGAWGWFVTFVLIVCLATLSRRLTELTAFAEELRTAIGGAL